MKHACHHSKPSIPHTRWLDSSYSYKIDLSEWDTYPKGMQDLVILIKNSQSLASAGTVI